MATRVKMVLHYKEDRPEYSLLTFGAVTSGSKENEQFFKYTPGGQLSFYAVNPESVKDFQIGKQYYIDIFQAE